jgi:protein required for attachment to host cells
MPGIRIPYDALVLIGDGKKAIFYRNKGDGELPNLIVEQVMTQDDVSSRSRDDVPPGQAAATPAEHGVAQGQWQQFDESRFADDIAEALYKAAHAGRYEKLVVAAPPKTLGELRKAFHKEVSVRIVAEVNKDLTGHDVGDIEAVLTSHD